MRRINTTTAGKGFKGRRTLYRIAWSDLWFVDPAGDFRTTTYRIAVREGKAGVVYVRGAPERDAALRRLTAPGLDALAGSE